VSQNICFIGAGNMASSLIGGLLANGYAAAAITACDINAGQLAELQQRFGINTSSDNLASSQAADVVMLAIKPQLMREVCCALSSLPSNPEQLFVSIAAGVPAAAIERWLGGQRSIVRCMPNTPALVQLGASGLAANAAVSASQRELAEKIIQAAAGVELGLPPATAAQLARQTALGAATMAQDKDVVELRNQVTSKKGTTEQAILSFQHDRLDQLVRNATAAAQRRSLELAHELTEE